MSFLSTRSQELHSARPSSPGRSWSEPAEPSFWCPPFPAAHAEPNAQTRRSHAVGCSPSIAPAGAEPSSSQCPADRPALAVLVVLMLPHLAATQQHTVLERGRVTWGRRSCELSLRGLCRALSPPAVLFDCARGARGQRTQHGASIGAAPVCFSDWEWPKQCLCQMPSTRESPTNSHGRARFSEKAC